VGDTPAALLDQVLGRDPRHFLVLRSHEMGRQPREFPIDQYVRDSQFLEHPAAWHQNTVPTTRYFLNSVAKSCLWSLDDPSATMSTA